MTVTIHCHNCTMPLRVEFGGDDVGKLIQAAIFDQGWAFHALDLALCPACVKAYQRGFLGNPVYDKLFKDGKGVMG